MKDRNKVVKDFFEWLDKLSAHEFEIIHNYHKIVQEIVIENQKQGRKGEQLFLFDEEAEDDKDEQE